ncbi:hypothetical protein PFLUV_G00184520 [Perca fluviatilis]|uniref:Peptidase A2 domain-containing protein n=1 Tax=Perca fluviatilis TaxID=8168 RepID=A0A6A5EC73_PERFL|nr:hypothetical protein PFLUV_G00184520 [Perca fluviatilis]
MDSADLVALKGKRSTAQSSFSKRAKKLSLTVDLLEKRVLIDEIRALEVLEWEALVSGAKTTVYKQQLYKLVNRLHDWVRSWQKLKRTEENDGGEEVEEVGTDERHSKSGEGPTRAGMQNLIPSVTPVPSTGEPAHPYVPTQSIPSQHPGAYGFRPQISQRTCLPTFLGDITDYYRWKAEWEELEQLGNPQRTAGVTRFHLLASLSNRVKKDLVLSSCASADEMFRCLDNHFGNKAKIVLKISDEVQGLPPVKGDNPRKAIEPIQAVERALSNLVILGEEEVIRNCWVAQSLESKLPSSLKEKWIAHKTEPVNGFAPHDHFDCLLRFLKKREAILEELDQLEASPREGGFSSVKGPADKPERGVKKAFSKATSGRRGSQSKPLLGLCTACADETHAGRLFACKAFREMDLQRRKAHLKTHGMCNRCLCFHLKDFIAQERDAGSEEQGTKRVERKGLGLTSKQEELLAKVTPELRAEFRKAFSNKASTTICTAGGGLREYPVIMMLLEVATNSGQLIGTLIDLASDTNYITNNAAQHLGLIGERIKLIVHGIGGMRTAVLTKRYSLRLRVKTTKGTVMEHKLLCYGLESIAEISQPVTPQQLQKIFPDVAAEELVRPENIDLLISHREGRLVPQPFKLEGDLVLWDGPLSKTVGGTHPDLFEVVDLTLHQSETHFARSMRTSSRVYKEVLVHTKDLSEDLPRMEEVTLSSTTTTNKGCLSGSSGIVSEQHVTRNAGAVSAAYPPGGKEMTLGEERDCLSYVLADKYSDAPHWDAAYPWKVSPAILPDNRRAVEATFKNTEARLARDSLWKAAYGEQIREMVSRGAAIELMEEEIKGWDGPI